MLESEDLSAAPKPKAALWKRVCAWTVVLVMYAVVAGMAVGAIVLIRFAFRSGTSLDNRLTALPSAALLLMLPVRLAWTYLSRRWTTGRWLMTKAESTHKLSQCAARRPVATQTPPWSWIQFAVAWANYSAMESLSPLWQRALGWIILVALIALMLVVTGFSFIMIGAGIATMNSGGLMMIGFGAVLLLIPAQFVWACIRRRSETGSLRTSAEELREMGVQRTEWQARETRKSLRSKIISTLVLVAILGPWWIRTTLHHSQHPHESWLSPALWTPFAIYLIWIQFRRPKGATPQTVDPPAATQI